MPKTYGFQKETADKLVRLAGATIRRPMDKSGRGRPGIAAGSGGCKPETYIADLRMTATAIQFQRYNVETCELSDWITLLQFTDTCPTEPV